jgi:hypothetical protein
MDSDFILSAIKKKYPGCAIVPELSVDTVSRSDTGASLRRIDALMLDGNGQRTAIEIKISVADTKNEKWEKHEPWRRITHRFIYVVPEGMLDNYNKIVGLTGMSTCGVWSVSPEGKITIQRNAVINKYPEALPQNVVTRIAYRADKVWRD